MNLNHHAAPGQERYLLNEFAGVMRRGQSTLILRAVPLQHINRLNFLRTILILAAMLISAPEFSRCADNPSPPPTISQPAAGSASTNSDVTTNGTGTNILSPPHPSNEENERQRWWLLGLMFLLLIVAVVFRRRGNPAKQEASN